MPIFKQDYKVLVRCFTFNHSKYIKDALDGFVMQKTDFPFVCAIVDDCSTDGEQDVIQSYLNTEFNMDSAELYETDYANIIVAEHKTNINCSFAVFFLKYNHYSIKKPKTPYLLPLRDICSYEAICEGDDFWIDEKKLQKQVNIMDNNPNIGFVYTAFETANKDGEFTKYDWCEERMESARSGDIFAALLDHNFILTLTMCVRMDLVKKYVSLDRSNCPSIDYFMYLFFSGNAYGEYVPEKMGCYRVVPSGMVQSSLERVNRLCDRAAVRISLLYLKGIFFKRSFWSDVNIKSVILMKLHRVQKRGLVDASECKEVIKEYPLILMYLPIALSYVLYGRFKRLICKSKV